MKEVLSGQNCIAIVYSLKDNLKEIIKFTLNSVVQFKGSGVKLIMRDTAYINILFHFNSNIILQQQQSTECENMQINWIGLHNLSICHTQAV